MILNVACGGMKNKRIIQKQVSQVVTLRIHSAALETRKKKGWSLHAMQPAAARVMIAVCIACFVVHIYSMLDGVILVRYTYDRCIAGSSSSKWETCSLSRVVVGFPLVPAFLLFLLLTSFSSAYAQSWSSIWCSSLFLFFIEYFKNKFYEIAWLDIDMEFDTVGAIN